MAECNRCGGQIRFLLTEKGKRMPVDWKPSELNGFVIVQRGVARALDRSAAAAAREQGYDLYAAHRCPGTYREQQEEAAAEANDRAKRARAARAPFAQQINAIGRDLGVTVTATLQRDQAIDQVDENADETWKLAALEAVKRTCLQLPEFISDDIWDTGELKSTREDRALGPVLLEARRRGWARKTDRVRPSVRSHLSGKPIWQSLIFEPGALNDRKERHVPAG